MLQLHYANRLENLLDPLAGAVEHHQRRDPLDTLSIIVPNRAAEQFVKYGMAERLGVAANLRFPFLRRYLAEIAERANAAIRVLEIPRLQVALFQCLRSEAINADSAFQPVRDYVAAANSTDSAVGDLRLFELAGRMAHLFQEYSISRTAMLRAWSSPNAMDRSEEEHWQRRLWTALFDRDGAARAEWTRDGEHRWMLLPAALASIGDAPLRDVLPPTLHVFGLASPGRVFLDIFARLGRLTNLNVYALNPCMEFWEDVDTSAAVRRETWRHRAEKIGAALEDREDPFDLAAPSDTRALQLWGRPGREYIRMLNELTECDFQPHFSPASGTSLLARLQRDILVRAVEGSGEQPAHPEPGSIRFLGTPGIRREAEVVANEVLRSVKDSEHESAKLRFHEIAVLVPDAVADAYLPHIETVFAAQFGIPVEIVGRRLSGSGTAEAIDLLLKFPLGRMTRDEVLRLLTHPAIAGAGSELDVDRLTAWCEELGVFFGADADDLADTYVPANLFQWDQALTRIALGAFMEGESSGETSAYDSEAGGLLPLALSQDDLPAAERFLRTARMLIADARQIASHSLPLGEWPVLVSRFIGTYVNISDPADQAVRDQCLQALESMTSLQTDPVGYQIAQAYIVTALSDLAAYQGGLSGRGVAAGSLAALRALPFRAIFVMGLNEATFPERDRRDPIDLRLARRHPGDISPPEHDRYLFLEAILSAREQITFSWIERNAQTGDRLEPSTTLRELQSILRAYGDGQEAANLVVSHKVSGYAPIYFPDLAQAAGTRPDSRFVSFDPEARRGARMIALHDHLEQAAGNRAVPGREELLDQLDAGVRAELSGSLGLFELPGKAASRSGDFDLPIAAIRRFLECPLQGAARYALGMVDDDGVPEVAIDEPIALSRLNLALLLRDAFWVARGDPEVFESAYLRALEIAQMKGIAPAGPFAKAALDANRARFARWCQELGPQLDELPRWQVIRIGRGDEFSDADRILPAVRLEVPAIGPDGKEVIRNVNLHGSVGAFSPSLARSLRLHIRREPKPQHFLESFIAAMVLRAAGEPVPPTFEALILTDPSRTAKPVCLWRQTLRTPSPEVAREYLSSLVSEMTSRAHDYFLPIEAVAAARDAMAAGKDPLDRIDNIREGWGSCASDYGPVRNSHDYEPPDRNEIAQIIERRFKLVEAIFE